MMRIQALEDWDYIPEFGGNREEEKPTVYSFTLLSGREEMELRKNNIPTFPDSLETVIKAVKNPPIIIDKKGNEKEASVEDIATCKELKGLFIELIVEYGRHNTLDLESAKL